MSAPSHSRAHLVAVVTAIVVTVLWSSSWILIRAGLDDEGLHPLSFAGLRYGLAALVLMGVVALSPSHRQEVRSVGPRATLQLAILGTIYYTLTQGAQFVAIDNQPAATTSLVLAMTPLLVAYSSGRSLGERAGAGQFVGAVLVIAGAALYLAGDLGATAIGITAAVIGLAANVQGSLIGRHINRAQLASPLVVTALSMTIGAVFLLIPAIVVDGVPTLTFRAAVIVVWLAIVNTALAFTLWNLSLQRLSAIESAGINTTMLIQIAVLAWVFLGESPGGFGLLGIVTVSIGVLLTQLRALPKGSPKPRQGRIR